MGARAWVAFAELCSIMLSLKKTSRDECCGHGGPKSLPTIPTADLRMVLNEARANAREVSADV